MGHDHDGAYRQFSLAQPEVAYVLLLTPDWHHHVLLFGSAASVWGYNRFGDALAALARVLTLTPALHYVDDCGAIQPTSISRISASKEQPPAPSHKIQGVSNDLSDTQATLRPCPDRVRHLTRTLSQCLEQGHMNSDTARRTGKCNYLQLCEYEAAKHAIRRPAFGLPTRGPLNMAQSPTIAIVHCTSAHACQHC